MLDSCQFLTNFDIQRKYMRDGPVAGTLGTRSRTTKIVACFFVVVQHRVCDIHATPRNQDLA